MLHPLPSLAPCQLSWQIEELRALRRFQEDVPEDARRHLLAAASAEGARMSRAAIADLWDGCLQALGLGRFLLHPEELTDLSAEQAEHMLEGLGKEGDPGRSADHAAGYTAGRRRYA